MDAIKIALGCALGLALAGLVLWAAGRLARRRRSNNISREGIYAWFRRRRLLASMQRRNPDSGMRPEEGP